MGRHKKKPATRPTEFRKPSSTVKNAWRESRNESNSSSLDALSAQSPQSQPGRFMRATRSWSSMDSASSHGSCDGRSSRKRSRVEMDEESRFSVDFESSRDNVFCSHCKEKESEVARLLEELTIRDQLKTELEEMGAKFKNEETSKEEAWARIKQEQEINEKLKEDLNKMRENYEEQSRLKDDALNRLSDMASSILRDNNANIADLSDQYRPTKIAEQFSELYDNEWTDAFGVLEDKVGEKGIIDFLLESLMKCFKICKEISTENYLEKVQRVIELPVKREPSSSTQCTLPAKLMQQIKEFRKSRAIHVIEDVIKEILEKVQSEYDNIEEVQAYKRKCIELCWLMVVQNPPLELSGTAQQQFDTNMFKDYTKHGKFVEYVVWPALLLHEDGPPLSKGVAQGCKKQT